jgi:uncharacterized membrane protein
MDDKTLQALTALAAKLNTTAEHLWSVLLRQAPITGVIDLWVMAVWMAGCVAWFRFVRRQTTAPAATRDDPDPSAAWSHEASVLAWVSVFVVVLISAFMLCGLSTIAAALLNPEYWALKQILQMRP